MVLKILITWFFIWDSVSCYNVLVAIPVSYKSHHQFGSDISKGLVAAGHQVTFISPFKQPNLLPNYEEIHLELTEEAVLISRGKHAKDIFYTKSYYRLSEISNLLRHTISVSVRNSKNFQRFLKSKRKFDIVIVESMYCEEILGLGHHFSAPIISMASVFESTEMNGFTAMPVLKSYMPTIYMSYTDKMNFWERLHNMISYLVINYVSKPLNWPNIQKNYELMFAGTENLPSLVELKKNVSLIILNSHPAIMPSRPLMPHMIEVGGLSIQPDEVEPLPNDLQVFLDEAHFGAVYFSLGTICNATEILIESNMLILRTFSELNTIRFLVKGDEALLNLLPNVPNVPNVRIQSWFPQKAILRHPNLKCFITHGGLNSIQESIWWAKPVVIIPFIFDQFMNAQWATEKGYGVKILYTEITSNVFKQAIENVLYNESYRRQAEITSKLFQDNLVSPMDIAVFWIEYVAATKGAPHLQSIATHFHTYVYYNLDVWTFYALIIVLKLFMSWKIASYIISLLKSRAGLTKFKAQ